MIYSFYGTRAPLYHYPMFPLLDTNCVYVMPLSEHESNRFINFEDYQCLDFIRDIFTDIEDY